jgi:hypothetical protein
MANLETGDSTCMGGISFVMKKKKKLEKKKLIIIIIKISCGGFV